MSIRGIRCSERPLNEATMGKITEFNIIFTDAGKTMLGFGGWRANDATKRNGNKANKFAKCAHFDITFSFYVHRCLVTPFSIRSKSCWYSRTPHSRKSFNRVGKKNSHLFNCHTSLSNGTIEFIAKKSSRIAL